MKLISIPNQQQLASFIPSNDIVRMVYELFKAVSALQIITNTTNQLANNPASGDTITIDPAATNFWLNINPALPIAALTIVFPLLIRPRDGQMLIITTTQAIAAITLVASGGDLISGNPASINTETPLLYRYSIDTNLWHLI